MTLEVGEEHLNRFPKEEFCSSCGRFEPECVCNGEFNLSEATNKWFSKWLDFGHITGRSIIELHDIQKQFIKKLKNKLNLLDNNVANVDEFIELIDKLSGKSLI